LTSVSSTEPATTSRPDRQALSERWGFALALLLIVATVVLYHSVKRYPFINFDDRDYILRNFQIQTGLEWDTVQWSFTTFYSSNWHPLTWLSHALDYQLFKLDPAGHHDTNVLFHALNAALLFWVLWRATGYAGRSFMVAALFALHPINVESVAWISERKNVLSMFFFLLALGAYRWYATSSFQLPVSNFENEAPPTGELGDSRKPLTNSNLETRNWKLPFGRYLVVMLFFALGLMAKPQVITFPFVLLLWDYWPLQRMFAPQDASPTHTTRLPARSLTWLIVEKLPLFALSAASAKLTLKAQGSTGALNGVFNSFPFSIRLENAIVSYVRYIGKAIWPSHLAVYYPHPETPLNPWQVAGAVVVLLAITALAIAGRRRRYFLVGWFWFLGTLIPMSGLVQVGAQAMADRYAYLPFIGLFIMFCWGVADFQPAVGRADSEWLEEGHSSSTWLAVACFALLLALAAVAHQQLWYWRNSLALWEHAAQTTTGNWMAEDMLGGVTLELGKGDLALAHYYRALALNPNDPISNVNIGNWNLYAGHPRDAIEYYQTVLRSARAPEVLRTKASEGLQRAYRDVGISNAAPEAPK
jgi:hypothetical protein